MILTFHNEKSLDFYKKKFSLNNYLVTQGG